MLTIQLELPWVSVAALAVAITTVAPAALALVLCIHHYAGTPHLQIPAGLLGGFLVLSSLSLFVVTPLPRRWPVIGISGTTMLVSAGLGIYWIAARFQTLMGGALLVSHLETALAALWATVLSGTAAVLAYLACENQYRVPDVDVYPTNAEYKPYYWPHGVETEPLPVQKLQMPAVDQPQDPQIPITMHAAHSSPHPSMASWPDTLGSIASETKTPTQGSSKFSKLSLSPKKLSVRKSPSKKGLQQSSSGNGLRPPMIPPVELPSLAGLAVPEGLPRMVPSEFDGNWNPSDVGQLQWMMMQSQDPQSRSVSGSSQQSGSIFGATDYNKKLNAAGFQRDEPVPVPKLRAKQSFSQYDLERVRHLRPSV